MWPKFATQVMGHDNARDIWAAIQELFGIQSQVEYDYLKQIFCVPAIAKKISKSSNLAQDNNVYLEFHSDYCFVKDVCKGSVVMKGILKDGLYQELVGATGIASSLVDPCLKSVD